jgi:hypothetical protein
MAYFKNIKVIMARFQLTLEILVCGKTSYFVEWAKTRDLGYEAHARV